MTACEFDPLRDEALSYALRLLQAGVSTEIQHYRGTFHGSHLIPAAVSDRMVTDAIAAVRRGIRVDSPAT